jgi:large subunit ribosomal protein L13
MKTAAKKNTVFKTYSPKKETLDAKWFLVDVKGKILGKVATKIADILRGKNKATFSNHLICGDFVVIINAEQIKLTGKKESQKTYYKHSQYPGGLKSITVEKLRETHPERILEHAVAGMIPNTKNKKNIMKRLKIYVGAEHKQTAQTPELINL